MRKLSFLPVVGLGALVIAAAGVAAASPADLHDVFTDELQVRSTVQVPADLDEFWKQVAS